MSSTDPDPVTEATGNAALEVDTNESDSAYEESSRPSSLLSLASEVTKGIYENGRRYHSFGSAQYAFPNDEPELERLDMQHAMMTLLLGNRLFWSPIDQNLQKVLDLGTGTGIWAIDFADLFPSAEVIGTDLSPIQPKWVPTNCHFEIDDAESEWTYERDSFDFIHNRMKTYWYILVHRSPTILSGSSQIVVYRHVKPGGWVEWHQKYPWFLSDDGSLAPNSPLEMWGKNFFEAADKFGTPCTTAAKLKPWMLEAGFVDVEEHILKLPVGPWPKDERLKKVGLFEMVNMIEGVEGLSMMAFTRALDWSPERVHLFLADVRKQARDRSVHSYYYFYIVFGRKPRK